jgi:hypothetical protein
MKMPEYVQLVVGAALAANNVGSRRIVFAAKAAPAIFSSHQDFETTRKSFALKYSNPNA